MLIDRTSNYLFIYFVGEKIFTNSNMVDGSLEQEIVGDKPRSPSIFEADIFHPRPWLLLRRENCLGLGSIRNHRREY